MQQCLACEKQLPKREIMYTENKEVYCNNPFTCNENHPNAAQRILERGSVVKLFTEKELDQFQTENLNLEPDEREKINRIVTKPMTVRINQVPLAYYLLQVQEYYGLGSLSEAIRYCVERMTELAPIMTPTEIEKPKQEIFTVNQEPKEEPKQETPEEDEMTF